MEELLKDPLPVLQAANPDWEIWKVPCYVGPTIWCARRHECHEDRLSTGDGPERLQEMITAWETARAEATAGPASA